MSRSTEEHPGSWRELLGPRFAPVATVLAAGVLLEASGDQRAQPLDGRAAGPRRVARASGR